MSWDYNFSQSARKDLKRLDKTAQERIIRFLRRTIKEEQSPRSTGKSLTGSLAALWRYRVGDYRVICEIQDAAVTVLVVKVGHRREVYR